MNNVLKSVLSIVLIVGVSACATNQSQSKAKALKASAEGAQKQVTLKSSLAYIPQRKSDPETGQILPYVKAQNPYLTQQGQINTASVMQFIKARRLYQQKNYAAADEELKKIIEKDKTIAGPWVMRGDIAHKNSNNQQSETFYRHAISINADNINAYIGLAKALRLQGKFIEAQNTYVAALERWRDFPEAHLNLAILYDIYLNRQIEAQRHLEAYQFLTQGKDKKAEKWLKELQVRTKQPIKLKVEVVKADSDMSQTN